MRGRGEARQQASTRPPKPSWDDLDELGEHAQLCATRLEHLVEVREPIVLISQIQRSGGTLLSQLFDGHPECHAHPGELHIGHPQKWDWPPLDLERPEQWFELLFEKPAYKALRDGYRKPSSPDIEHDVFPFLFSPRLQKAIFERCSAQWPIERERDVLDCYFTSYFNAWLDNHNLYATPKRIVTGFAARLSSELENVERFFAAYADGLLVSVVRDPCAWYASARRHRTHYHDLDTAMGLWHHATAAAIAARERWPEHVVLLTYEDLVQETERTMRRVADKAGISMSPVLLTPTFNGRPIRANSSIPVDRYGVIADRAQSGRAELDDGTISRIQSALGDLYEQGAGLARG